VLARSTAPARHHSKSQRQKQALPVQEERRIRTGQAAQPKRQQITVNHNKFRVFFRAYYEHCKQAQTHAQARRERIRRALIHHRFKEQAYSSAANPNPRGDRPIPRDWYQTYAKIRGSSHSFSGHVEPVFDRWQPNPLPRPWLVLQRFLPSIRRPAAPRTLPAHTRAANDARGPHRAEGATALKP